MKIYFSIFIILLTLAIQVEAIYDRDSLPTSTTEGKMLMKLDAIFDIDSELRASDFYLVEKENFKIYEKNVHVDFILDCVYYTSIEYFLLRKRCEINAVFFDEMNAVFRAMLFKQSNIPLFISGENKIYFAICKDEIGYVFYELNGLIVAQKCLARGDFFYPDYMTLPFVSGQKILFEKYFKNAYEKDKQ